MRDEILYRLIKMVLLCLGHLPRWFLTFLADGLGLIWFKLDKRHRMVVMDNIQKAYPGEFSESRARRFAKDNFKHTAGIMFEVIWSYSKTPDQLFEYFTIKGASHLEKALKKGRGAMGLTCHMGVFELHVAGIAKAGFSPFVLYRKLDFPPLERLTKEMRERFGSTMVPVKNASKKIESIFSQGHLSVTLLDQNVDWYQGVFVDFFGRPACTNKKLAQLIMKNKVPILPGFIIKKDGKHIVEIFPEIPVQDTGDPIKDIENNTQLFVSAIESMVRQCPEQYFWVHNRWKTKSYCTLESSQN